MALQNLAAIQGCALLGLPGMWAMVGLKDRVSQISDHTPCLPFTNLSSQSYIYNQVLVCCWLCCSKSGKSIVSAHHVRAEEKDSSLDWDLGRRGRAAAHSQAAEGIHSHTGAAPAGAQHHQSHAASAADLLGSACSIIASRLLNLEGLYRFSREAAEGGCNCVGASSVSGRMRKLKQSQHCSAREHQAV